jgi:molybdopterin synthase sulfur carrier subunit
MQLTVRYFASLREALGPQETVDAGALTDVGSLRDWLVARSPRHASALARGLAVRVAVDQAICDDAAPLHDGAEVAFFPPVTGG